jgi:hypothetical protein
MSTAAAAAETAASAPGATAASVAIAASTAYSFSTGSIQNFYSFSFFNIVYIQKRLQMVR